MICSVKKCIDSAYSKGFCQKHYTRQWRNGSTDKTRIKKDFYVHSKGYIILNKEGHRLSDKMGRVYQHRYVYFEENGEGPFNCNWCNKAIDWSILHIDHVDEIKDNNDISNLVASCHRCNCRRSSYKIHEAGKMRSGIEFNGVIYSVQELADIKGVHQTTIRNRMKTMTIYETMDKPIKNRGVNYGV